MKDKYQSWTKSAIGKFFVKKLGLPSPVYLDRYRPALPVVNGAVLLGAADGSLFIDEIAAELHNMRAGTYADEDNTEIQAAAQSCGLNLLPYNEKQKDLRYKALVFDASGIQTIAQLKALYSFFHPVARKIHESGRVIVVGISPETAGSLEYAAVQRALEGFVRSVGKEFKKGITAQLVSIDRGAQNGLESTLRFLLSPRSAYVSGQVIRIGASTTLPEINWNLPLAGKTAVVTGAARGIGEAIARILARDGAHVICLDVAAQQESLVRLSREIGGSILVGDITAGNIGEEIKNAAADKGGLDIIVHNAGITRDKTLANMKPEMWDLVLEINLAANLRVNEYLLKNNGLNKNGRIICVSSISGIAGNLGQSNYAASKAGVIGLVKFTAPTLTDGITINAVAPGFIETQMTAAIPMTIREAGRRMNSMSQGGQTVDVAETVAYFACPASGSLNGNILRVCGQSLLGA